MTWERLLRELIELGVAAAPASGPFAWRRIALDEYRPLAVTQVERAPKCPGYRRYVGFERLRELGV